MQQAARQCERAYPDKTVEIEMGSQHATGAADITVASIQSLKSMGRLDKYNPKRFKLVLIDEAHHIVAPGYLEVLEHFGLYKPQGINVTSADEVVAEPMSIAPDSPALVGVSATFSRFDGMRLGTAIDHIVYHKDYVDMIGEKWLSDVKFTTVKSKADLRSVRASIKGDFQTGQLSKAVNTPETNAITVTSWLSEAECRKSTLIFCVDINHVKDLTSAFRQHGIDARYITGMTKLKERAVLLDQFKNREFPLLLNCAVFTEGTDIPNIDCVVLARPTKSRNLLVQMIGRGMRLFPGKENCHVIDMVASLETGIVTVPTLFGLDPSEMVKDASADDLKKLKEKDQLGESGAGVLRSSRNISEDELSFTHYSTVHDLIEDTSGERHIRANSANAWVQVDSEKYILNAKGGILTLERRTEPRKSPSSNESDTGDNFVAIWKHPLPPGVKSKSPYSKPRIVASASTFSALLHAADTFAASQFERLFIATSSSWRRSPASGGQLSFLNKLRAVSEEEPLTPDDLTKGQAADMITKIKFGARGRFDKLQVSKRKAEREIDKIDKFNKMRAREHVKVGPLSLES